MPDRHSRDGPQKCPGARSARDAGYCGGQGPANDVTKGPGDARRAPTAGRKEGRGEVLTSGAGIPPVLKKLTYGTLEAYATGMPIYLLATLDTKGIEATFVRDR